MEGLGERQVEKRGGGGTLPKSTDSVLHPTPALSTLTDDDVRPATADMDVNPRDATPNNPAQPPAPAPAPAPISAPTVPTNLHAVTAAELRRESNEGTRDPQLPHLTQLLVGEPATTAIGKISERVQLPDRAVFDGRNLCVRWCIQCRVFEVPMDGTYDIHRKITFGYKHGDVPLADRDIPMNRVYVGVHIWLKDGC